jgi:hypothetical protein
MAGATSECRRNFILAHFPTVISTGGTTVFFQTGGAGKTAVLIPSLTLDRAGGLQSLWEHCGFRQGPACVVP